MISSLKKIINIIPPSVQLKLADPRARVACGSLFVGLLIISWYVLTSNREVTDNAIVKCEWSDVISEVRGVVSEIKFEDDQFLQKGDIVVTIEDSLYKSQLDQAQSQFDIANVELDVAKNRKILGDINIDGEVKISKTSFGAATEQLSALKLEIKSLEASLASAASKLEKVKSEFERSDALFQKKYISVQKYEDIKTEYLSSISDMEALKARLESTRKKQNSEMYRVNEAKINSDNKVNSEKSALSASDAAVKAAEANLALAKATLDAARINYDRTKIHTRRAGYITNRKISVGQYVEVGQPIASVISSQENVWIEANFKETQIKRIAHDQKVKFTIDAYPGKEFIGKVKSISGGSGATFSVIPPENATGNFTKVVKRFPVRIAVVETYGLPMRVGMSAVVKVLID